MRVVEYRTLTQLSGMLSGADGFAALGGALATDPAIGGFRIVRPRQTRHALIRLRSLRQMTGTRLHASGTLSVLLLGALALVVLVGPASNTGTLDGTQDRTQAPESSAASGPPTTARFAYSRHSDAELATGPPSHDDAGARAEDAQAADVSPISTAAIPDAGSARAHIDTLLPKAETLAAAPPEPLRLAAADPAYDTMIPTLPVVEIEVPERPAAATTEIEPRGNPAVRHRIVSKRHARSARHAPKARGSADPAVTAVQKYGHAPRWAQQMFDNPWQSKAFSYIR